MQSGSVGPLFVRPVDLSFPDVILIPTFPCRSAGIIIIIIIIVRSLYCVHGLRVTKREDKWRGERKRDPEKVKQHINKINSAFTLLGKKAIWRN